MMSFLKHAEAGADDKTMTDAERYLEFSLGKEKFGIQLLQVRELISVPETTPIPYSPKYFKGIMNLRGQVISVIDLRLKLGVTSNEDQSENAVVIVEFDGFRLGLIVDSINKVLQIEDGQIAEVPEVKATGGKDYINGVFKNGDDLVVLLELPSLLSVREIHQYMEKVA